MGAFLKYDTELVQGGHADPSDRMTEC